MKQAVLTAVYGNHAERLDETFTSFARHAAGELHAFVVGDRLPRNQVAGVRYHLREPDSRYVHPMRDVDYRRWLFVDEVGADSVLVVDGLDVLCLQPLPPFASLLKGGWVAAAVEHNGGRYLGNGLYTSNFVNAGVTFWDVAASRELRETIAERGRARFRSLVDDQLALNELLHARYPDRLTLLPCHYNYRGSLGRLPWGWPKTRTLDGVRIYHNGHWVGAARQMTMPAGQAVLDELPADANAPGVWAQRWRRFLGRMQRTGFPPWLPRG